MSWTDLEYEIVKVYGDHVYDSRPPDGQVGLGICRCGERMYWCDHSTHFARAMIKALDLPNPEPPPRVRGRAIPG